MTIYANPIAHRNDPETSYEAAEGMERSGARWTHAQLLLATLEVADGLTACELGEVTGLGRVEAARRLTDLHHAGQVRQGEPRQCHGGRCKRQVAWSAAPKQGALL